MRGRRASRNRTSSRVSSSAGTFSATSSGSGVSARERISNELGTSSRPPGAFSVALISPVTMTTDSRETDRTASTTSGGTFFFGTVTCRIPVLSRRRTNVSPPRSRTSWTNPTHFARPSSGVTFPIGVRIEKPEINGLCGVIGFAFRLILLNSYSVLPVFRESQNGANAARGFPRGKHERRRRIGLSVALCGARCRREPPRGKPGKGGNSIRRAPCPQAREARSVRTGWASVRWSSVGHRVPRIRPRPSGLPPRECLWRSLRMGAERTGP